MTIIEPLEKIGSQLSYAWGVTSHLNGVRNTQELRAAYEKVRVVGALDLVPKILGEGILRT